MGKKSRFVREGYFVCEICEEMYTRNSNCQKYCDGCRQLGKSRNEAAYYRRNRGHILRKRAAWRKAHREEILARQRQYHIDTKLERPTRPMLREMKELEEKG